MNDHDANTARAVARAAGEAMLAGDRCSQGLCMELVDVDLGRASLRMTVREDMLNGLGTCHGGVIFSLADSCFALACNSRDQRSVAVNCLVDYVRPARPGDVLLAESRELSLAGRNGVYDVVVRNQHGDIVACFRGKSRTIAGSVTGNDAG